MIFMHGMDIRQLDLNLLKAFDALATALQSGPADLRFQAATGQLEKTHRVQEVRRDIARIKSVLSARPTAA